MQNGVLKHRVEGANTPAIAGTVSKLTPTVADADELEVRADMAKDAGLTKAC